MNKSLNSLALLTVSIVLLATLPNCAKYKPRPLSTPRGIVHEKEGVEVAKQALSEEDSKRYFDRRFVVRGYQPIQLHISNNSNKTYYLDANNIKLPLEPVRIVSRKLHRDIGWKATKYFVIGGPFWAAIEGFRSHEVNKEIDNDLLDRSIDENDIIKIKPYGVVNRVMFVSNTNYVSKFELSLIDENKQKLSFEL